MTIQLSPEVEEQVRKDAAAGGFEGLQEYVEMILMGGRYVADWVPDDEEKVRAQIAQGLEEAERGELFTEEQVRQHMAQVKAEFMKRRSAA